MNIEGNMRYLITSISTGMNPCAICDCGFFAKHLMKLIFRTITEDDELSMWTAFENDLKEYVMAFTLSDGSYSVVSCSLTISSFLIRSLEALRRSDIEVLTILISIIKVIYSTDTERECFFTVSYVQNPNWFFRCYKKETDQVLAAFRGRFHFMKFLVMLGSVKSLPTESSILYKETQKNIREFM